MMPRASDRAQISCPECGQIWIIEGDTSGWRFPVHYDHNEECPSSEQGVDYVPTRH